MDSLALSLRVLTATAKIKWWGLKISAFGRLRQINSTMVHDILDLRRMLIFLTKKGNLSVLHSLVGLERL